MFKYHHSSALLLTVLLGACAPTRPAEAPEPTAPPAAEPAEVAAPPQKIDAPSAVGAAPTSPIVLGYFTNWAHQREGECKFKTQDVNTKILTHINYSFALIEARDENGVVLKDASQLSDKSVFELIPSSSEDESRLYQEVLDLKKQRPDLKVMLSVGGWAFNDDPTSWIFTQMASDAERRGHFIRQATKYLRKFGFDGIDIDWEFPGAAERGGRPEDGANFTALLNEFRAHFHEEAGANQAEELLLTVATPAGEYFSKGIELDKIHPALNWINVMTYDYHGGWDKETGANAPLTGGSPDIRTTIEAYKAAGIPADKLVLGLATYARSWGGVKNPSPGAEATAVGPHGACGPESLRATEVTAWVKEGLYQGAWDEATQTPYAFNKKEETYITYDNERSFELKLKYLKQEKLAGAMFWAIDLDDFKNGYPLISLTYKRVVDEAEPSAGAGAEPAPAAAE